MKRIIPGLILILLIGSCSDCQENKLDRDPDQIIGKWQLIEQLADPGDGSGEFTPVESNKTIEFYNDGTYQSNGLICLMNSNSGQQSTGTYDAEKKVLVPDDCQLNQGSFTYEISYQFKDSHLILHFLCIEPCAEKYKRID